MRTRRRSSLPFNRGLLYGVGVLVACLLAVAPAGAQEAQAEVRHLPIGTAAERKVAGQEVHLYGAELKRGQALRVSIQEKGADVSAAVVNVAEQEKVLAISRYGSGFMRESLTLIPEQDGVYILAVRAEQITDAGAGYVLSAALNVGAGQADFQRVQAERLLAEASLALISSDARGALAVAAKLEESIRVWRALGDRYWEALSTAGLSGAYLKAEDHARAELRILEALKIFEELKDEPGIALACFSLGSLYVATNNEAKVKPYLDRALEISRRLGDRRAENILSLVDAAEAGVELTEEDTRKYDAEVSAARAKNDRRAEAAVWARAVFRYAVGGEDLVAEVKRPLIERVEREALPLLRVVRDRDVELQLRLGLAICFYDLTLSTDTDEDDDLIHRSKSMKYLHQALVLAKVQNNLTMLSFAYMHLDVYYSGDNDRLAIFFSKKAINALQQFRQDFRLLDKESQQEVARQSEEGYGSLASDLFYESRFAEAHQVLNFGRDQEFFDFQLTQNTQRARLTLTRREAESDRMFEGALDGIAAKYGGNRDAHFASAGEELKAAFETLEENFAGPRSEQDVARDVPDAADMQTSLRELSAKTGRRYAAIYTVEDLNEILLITAEGLKGFAGDFNAVRMKNFLSAAPAEKNQTLLEMMKAQAANQMPPDDDETLQQFLKVLSSPDYDPRPLGAEIYNKIFKSQELVGGKTTGRTLEAELAALKPDVLLWSLRGNLRYVPMAALYDDGLREYLGEKYQNAVFTRARKERFLIEPKPWTRGVGFGTSVAYRGFEPLPGVVNEVTAIFGNTATGRRGFLNGRVFLNQEFTRQALLAIQQNSPPLVHIASHFKFQAGDSRNSFLLLGDGNKFSLLDMQQNPNLFAGVDLLTLSACETAAQQPGANGKEVDGFAELAQRLGASSVLATLWKVNDDGTSRLMTEFYRLRRENPAAPKSETLQQSQLNLLNGKSTAEGGRRRRRSRGTEVAETDDDKSQIPFTPAAESPFEHPYYWAPFVLYGSSR